MGNNSNNYAITLSALGQKQLILRNCLFTAHDLDCSLRTRVGNMQTTIDAVGNVLAVNDDDGDSEESSDGQRLNDSQRATSLASHTAHKAEEMLRRMDIKHKYKSVSVTYILTHTHTPV